MNVELIAENIRYASTDEVELLVWGYVSDDYTEFKVLWRGRRKDVARRAARLYSQAGWNTGLYPVGVKPVGLFQAFMAGV